MKNILFLFFFLPFVSYAQWTKVADSKPFEEKLRTTTQDIETLSSDFTQIKHIDVLSENIESTGRFVYKKQNLLRWQYTAPFEYLIVLNNGKLSIKDEKNTNTFDLSNNKTFKKINDMITQSLQGSGMMTSADYKHELLEDSKEFLLKLFPQDKKTKEFMQQIEIHFSKSDYQPKKLKLLETSGDYTTIVFKNRKINETVSDRMFTLD